MTNTIKHVQFRRNSTVYETYDALVQAVSAPDFVTAVLDANAGENKIKDGELVLLRYKEGTKINTVIGRAYDNAGTIEIHIPTKAKGVKISANDKFLTEDTDGLKAEINLVTDAEGNLVLIGKDKNTDTGIKTGVKFFDSFLNKVTLVDSETAEPKIKFEFKTNNNEIQPIEVPMKDLKDVYTAGNGISIDNQVVSLKIVSGEETALVKLVATENGASVDLTNLNSKISELSTSINDLKSVKEIDLGTF